MESVGGFFCSPNETDLFSYLWTAIASQYKTQAVASTKTWKLKIDLKVEAQTVKVEADEDFSEGEEDIPAQAASIEINLREVDEDKMYCEFVRKSGNAMLFAKFVRDMSVKCDMFKSETQTQ